MDLFWHDAADVACVAPEAGGTATRSARLMHSQGVEYLDHINRGRSDAIEAQ